MDRFKHQYTEIVNQRILQTIKTTKEDFVFNVRLAMMSAKTTKNTLSESIMGDLIDKMWVQFIKDCENPKIGVTKAIDKVFNKYQ